jgi:hypothetical protein
MRMPNLGRVVIHPGSKLKRDRVGVVTGCGHNDQTTFMIDSGAIAMGRTRDEKEPPRLGRVAVRDLTVALKSTEPAVAVGLALPAGVFAAGWKTNPRFGPGATTKNAIAQ